MPKSRKTVAPKMMPRLYIKGASAGAMNTPFDCSTPISRPLTPNTTVAASMMRISETVSAACASPKPGATIVSTRKGANNAAMTASTERIPATLSATMRARRHPRTTCPRLSRAVKMGMKAEANAPPASRLNSKSGMRNAALNASYSALAPNCDVTTTRWANPIRLPKA